MDAFLSVVTEHTTSDTGIVADTHDGDSRTCREALRSVKAFDDTVEIYNGRKGESTSPASTLSSVRMSVSNARVVGCIQAFRQSQH
ncbi:hypothetical protein [Roseomonas sp. WA12]